MNNFNPVILSLLEKLLIPADPGQFHFVNQGELTVDGMDDKEEMEITDVRILFCFAV